MTFTEFFYDGNSACLFLFLLDRRADVGKGPACCPTSSVSTFVGPTMSLLWSFPRLGAAMHRHIHRHIFIPTGAVGPALTPALRPTRFQPSRAMSESSKPARATVTRDAQEILGLIEDRESLEGAGYVTVMELKNVARHLGIMVKGTRVELLARIRTVDGNLADVLATGTPGHPSRYFQIRGAAKTRIQVRCPAGTSRFLALVFFRADNLVIKISSSRPTFSLARHARWNLPASNPNSVSLLDRSPLGVKRSCLLT